MDEIKRYLEEMITEALVKMVISNPKSKSEEYRKIVVNRKKNGFQIEKYTEKQVFHENITLDTLLVRCFELVGAYRQVDAWDAHKQYTLLVSQKGKCTF